MSEKRSASLLVLNVTDVSNLDKTIF